MIPYFLLFLCASIPAALESSRKAKISTINFLGPSLLLFVFIGFRYQTGGDWFTYYQSLSEAYGFPFWEFLSTQAYEPLYALLNWFGANEFGGLVFVNSVCALIFSFSLLWFCRSQPNPWLALTLAIPYLVIVVAMGYTRQSVAIAFEMLALVALQNGRAIRFALLIFIGSLFHRSVLILFALLPFSSQSFFVSLPSRYAQLLKLIFIAIAGFGFYSENSSNLSSFVQGYQGDYGNYSPQGAILRVGVTALFSLIFLLRKNSFVLSVESEKIWTALSLFMMLAVVALAFGFLPTLVDRLALYFLPIQLFVGSRLPETQTFGIKAKYWRLLLISFSLLFLCIWFNFAYNRAAWLPYVNFLI